MEKDKYLKESLNTQRLRELASKYGLTNYLPGQSFDSVKEKMSAEDYETGNKLLNYYTNQKSVTDDYNYNTNIIEQNQKKNLQENAISKELAMKYLPEHLKLQGMGGLGVSESAVVSANNNYRNARNTINANTDSLKNELLKSYQETMNDLDSGSISEIGSIREKYQAIRDNELLNKYNSYIDMLNNKDFVTIDDVEKWYEGVKGTLDEDRESIISDKVDNYKDNLAKEEAETLFNNFADKLNYGEFNTSTELEESYNNIKDKLSDSQKSILEDKINYYKNNLAQKEADAEYEEQKINADTETKKQAEIDERVLSGKEYVSYGGNNYQIKSKLNINANELRNNNSFKEQLQSKCGTTNPFDSNIPNGTTFEIKVDAAGKDNQSAWNWIAGILTVGMSELAMGSIYRKYVTYYNGDWYVSEKK